MTRISDLVAQAQDIETEDVEIPRWGVTVRVQSMSGVDRAKYIQNLVAAQEEDSPDLLSELDAQLVVACTFDPETDEPAFLVSDIPMLMSKAGDILGALSIKAQRLSGLDGKAEERLGKASSTSGQADSLAPVEVPNADSSSVSPEN